MAVRATSVCRQRDYQRGPRPWSVEAWIKPTSFNATNMPIIQFARGSGVYLYMNGAGVSALYVQGSAQTGLTLSTGSVYLSAGIV